MASTDLARAGPGIAPVVAALCAGAVAMGISPIFVRYAAADVGPFASAFWRVALALPVLYAWMRLDERGRATPPGRPFGAATLLAGLAFAGDLFFWHLSILATTVANATFFATTAPIFVVLIAWAALRQRIAPATLAGLALCLLGGLALVGQSFQVDPARLRGDLYGVATAFFFGLYFIAVGRARDSGASAGRVTFELSLSRRPCSSASPLPSATGSGRRASAAGSRSSPWPGSATRAGRDFSRWRLGDCRRCSPRS